MANLRPINNGIPTRGGLESKVPSTESFSKFFVESSHKLVRPDYQSVYERMRTTQGVSILIGEGILKSTLEPNLEGNKCIWITGKHGSDIAAEFSRGVDSLMVSTPEQMRTLIAQLDTLRGRPKQVIIAFGGGNSLDIAKYVASEAQTKLIVVPTILSTNVYSTNKTTYKTGKDGVAIPGTVDTKTPELVIIDLNLISKSPTRLNVSGAGDVLCVASAIEDWGFAKRFNNEKIDPATYEQVLAILDGLYSQRKAISVGEKTGLLELAGLLACTGDIVNIYGNGRPVSGSEHILEVAIRKHLPQAILLHGEVVALGVLIMTLLQEKDYGVVAEFMDDLALPRSISKIGVGRDVLEKSLADAKDVRKDRFTVLNVRKFDEWEAKFAIQKLFDESILLD